MLLSVDLANGNLTKICDACGQVDTVALADLKLGGGIPPRVNPNTMQMPQCSNCDGVEIMIRNWDITPVAYRASASCEQRAAKNALAQYLKAHGQQDPQAVSAHAAEVEDPPEMMDLADAKDLRVPHSDRVDAHAAHNASVANRTKNPRITFGTHTPRTVLAPASTSPASGKRAAPPPSGKVVPPAVSSSKATSPPASGKRTSLPPPPKRSR